MAQVWKLGIVLCSEFAFISFVPFFFSASPLPSVETLDCFSLQSYLFLNSFPNCCQCVSKCVYFLKNKPKNVMYLLKYLHGFPLLQAAFQSPQLYMKIFCHLAAHICSLISCHSPLVPYAPAPYPAPLVDSMVPWLCRSLFFILYCCCCLDCPVQSLTYLTSSALKVLIIYLLVVPPNTHTQS